MSNLLRIPKLNGVSFYEVDPVLVAQYLSRDPDDVPLKEQIRGYEMKVDYAQPWLIADSFPMQLMANFDAITLDVITCDGVSIYSQPVSKRKANADDPGTFVYQSTLSFNIFSPGRYWLTLTLAGGTKLISEPIDLDYDHPDTMLFEYWSDGFHGDVLFETLIHLKFRAPCVKRRYQPGSQRTMYDDMTYDPVMLKSVPYRSWELIIGKDYGVPDWVAERLNWIFSCDHVLIDGKSYAIASDSQIEPAEVDVTYRMAPYTVKVREGVNRASKYIAPDFDLSKKIIATAVIDSTMFGDLYDQGQNLIQITGLE